MIGSLATNLGFLENLIFMYSTKIDATEYWCKHGTYILKAGWEVFKDHLYTWSERFFFNFQKFLSQKGVDFPSLSVSFLTKGTLCMPFSTGKIFFKNIIRAYILTILSRCIYAPDIISTDL